MKKNRLGLSIGALVLVLLLLSACGNNKAKNETTTPEPAGSATAEKSSLDKIKESGKLRIGTEGTYAPFTFHDDSGKLTGFDVEIAEEVSKHLGVKPEFIETQWDGIFAGLEAGRFDAIFNEVSIREDRQEKYDFSDPYIVSKSLLLVREDNNEIKKLVDLKGKKSAQSLTSNLADIATANGAEIVSVDGFNQAIDLLMSKRVDATINDNLSFLDLKKQKPDIKIKSVDETSDASQSAALFAKGNDELIRAVNQALSDMKSDGAYLKISEKYFGADVSK
ncbi:amino acid ABC transporter substrate-binding protein [Paenibacillus kobensis]|uniref:amino acid ABC transporter substrate-binding protein n=1 Tax=Paenibacillus kobensis TaxID=59841 RepID=UPI000FD9B93D|nr:amino acid ABC transporter substrate-binding protein [Paenibacillus kobensis]